MSVLRRHTELPFLVEYLLTGQLAFLNPAAWEDRNDRQRLAEYQTLKKINSLYVCCFAECPETFHHWRIYSKGMNGVCIEFKKDELIKSFGFAGCSHGSIKYLDWKMLEEKKIAVDEIPFVKRDVFSDEREFRAIIESPKEQQSVFFQRIPVTAIRKIIVNPWLPESTANALFRTLKLIAGDDDLSLWRSQMLGRT